MDVFFKIIIIFQSFRDAFLFFQNYGLILWSFVQKSYDLSFYNVVSKKPDILVIV